MTIGGIMIDESITYECKPEAGPSSTGFRVYKNGKPGQWHWGYAGQTMVSLLSREIKKESSVGGTIVIERSWRDENVHQVEPCPTGHKNVVYDMMGGDCCQDCGAVW